MVGAQGAEGVSVGASAASASASLSTGALTVEYPISLPPARTKSTPDLSLVYSSASGMGPFGFGWSLTVGSISRDTGVGAPNCSKVDSSNPSNRLDPEAFLVNLGRAPGEMVKDSTSGNFYLKYDESWVEAIPPVGGPTGKSWNVKTRDGSRFEFGADSDARVFRGSDVKFLSSASACSLTTEWSLSSVEDPNGNQIRFEYEKHGNYSLPKYVYYGGNPSAGVTDPFRVEFILEDVAVGGASSRRVFSSGVEQTLSKRIARIEVHWRTSLQGSWELLRSYDLNFSDNSASGSSIFTLDTIDSSDDGADQTFEYASRDLEFQLETDPYTPPLGDGFLVDAYAVGNVRRGLFDMNGDGLTDLVDLTQPWSVYLGRVGGGFEPTPETWDAPNGFSFYLYDGQNGISSVATVDINGDGLADLVHARHQDNTAPFDQNIWDVYYGSCDSPTISGCGFLPSVEWVSPFPWIKVVTTIGLPFPNGSVSSPVRFTRTDLRDMNADGLPDLVSSVGPDGRVENDADSSQTWDVFFNTGSGFETWSHKIESPAIDTGPSTFPRFSLEVAFSPGAAKPEEIGERSLIDVNGDGLPDIVQASQKIYGALDGSYRVDGAGMPFDYFPGGPVPNPPSDWAIVPGIVVRLNNVDRFSDFIKSPHPFHWDNQGLFAELFRDVSGVVDSYNMVEFLDVTGDGLLDYVESREGQPMRFAENMGDGTFSAPLEVTEGHSSPGTEYTPWAFGEVRPTTTIPGSQNYLAKHKITTGNNITTRTYATTWDWDGDGLSDHYWIDGYQSASPHEIRTLRSSDAGRPHTRPLLMTKTTTGVGGVVSFQYAPSTKFDHTGSDGASDMPLITWVLTGIRRQDGLCDTNTAPPGEEEAGDWWFSLSTNYCLSLGHETVEKISYRDGYFDQEERVFRGFGRVVVEDGLGSARRVTFHQEASLQGRLIREDQIASYDPEAYDLGQPEAIVQRQEFEWETVVDAVVTGGVRTQVYLKSQKIQQLPVFAQAYDQGSELCTLHRNELIDSNGSVDRYNRVHVACSQTCAGGLPAPTSCSPSIVGQKRIETSWANPMASALVEVYERASEVASYYRSPGSGASELQSRVEYLYDGPGNSSGLPKGSVERGNLRAERQYFDTGPGEYVELQYEYDNDDGASGVGNRTSSLNLSSGIAPSRAVFGGPFKLYATRVEGPDTGPQGNEVSHFTENVWDLRNGKVAVAIGEYGVNPGDFTIRSYDYQGRLICEARVGEDCDAATATPAWREYSYSYANPAASDVLDRMNMVEVRTRAPGAPGDNIRTRTYSDGMGRVRAAVTQQFAVPLTQPSSSPSLLDVVSNHQSYAPNGAVHRSWDPYPFTGQLDLAPPSVATTYSYGLNLTLAWDPLARVGEVQTTDLAKRQTLYLGAVRREIDADGVHRRNHFDEHGRSFREETFEGVSTLLVGHEYEFNGQDRLVSDYVVGHENETKISRTFDLLGRGISRADPDSGTWTHIYDARGNIAYANDPKSGQHTQHCYDQMNRPILTCGYSDDLYDEDLCDVASPDILPQCPVGTVQYQYTYDESSTATPPNYGIGHLTSVSGPGQSESYAYDLRGNVTLESRTVRGKTAQFERQYDDVGRLDTLIYPDLERVKYSYDTSNQIVGLDVIDSQGGVTKTIVGGVKYNIRGENYEIVRGNGVVETFTCHDSSENYRLKSIEVKNPTSGNDLLDLEYTAYDGSGRLSQIVDHRTDSWYGIKQDALFDYDEAGRLKSVVGATPESFSYDTLGNLESLNSAQDLTHVYAAGAPHHLDRSEDSSGNVVYSYSYDANGSRTEKRDSAGTVLREYDFDRFGRMSRLVVNGDEKIFGYDASGQRIFEEYQENSNTIVRRTFGQLAQSEDGLLFKHYFLGPKRVAMGTVAAVEFSEGPGGVAFPEPLAIPPAVYTGAIASILALLMLPVGGGRRSIGVRVSASRGLGSALLLVFVSLPLLVDTGCGGEATIRHYHEDHRGDVAGWSDQTGTFRYQVRYSAFGQILGRFNEFGASRAPDQESRFEFTGHESDYESGLVYANARYYDPETAQFLSVDAAEESASPYAYTGWDPINFVDPSGNSGGLCEALLILGAILIVARAVTAGIREQSFSAFAKTLLAGSAGTGQGVVIGAFAQVLSTYVPFVSVGLAVAGVGASAYGVSQARGTEAAVFAGVGLALSIAGAAAAGARFGGGEPGSQSGDAARNGGRQGVQVAGGDATTDAQALEQARANENALTRARPPGRANVQGPANFFDVEANQELTVTVQNPNPTGIMVRVVAGLPGGKPNEIFAPTSPVGGFLGPIGGSVETTVTAFGHTPILYRVRVDVGGDLGVFVRFDTRGPVPPSGR